MLGSGRAILSLRQSYRDDLREVKSATDLKLPRFHAIFHDEVGVYDEDASEQQSTIFLTWIKSTMACYKLACALGRTYRHAQKTRR